MRYSRTSLPAGNYYVLFHERHELERAVNLIQYRIALACFDPLRFAWSCEPVLGGFRIGAVELPL